MPGRPRKPAALAKLQGNAGKRKPRKEPTYPKELPAPPPYLSAVGKKEWKRLAAVMTDARVLTAADWALFSAYCHAHEHYYAIVSALKKEKINTSEWGSLDRARKRAFEDLFKAISALGLSPTTRSKVSPQAEPSENEPFAVFPGGKN